MSSTACFYCTQFQPKAANSHLSSQCLLCNFCFKIGNNKTAPCHKTQSCLSLKQQVPTQVKCTYCSIYTPSTATHPTSECELCDVCFKQAKNIAAKPHRTKNCKVAKDDIVVAMNAWKYGGTASCAYCSVYQKPAAHNHTTANCLLCTHCFKKRHNVIAPPHTDAKCAGTTNPIIPTAKANTDLVAVLNTTLNHFKNYPVPQIKQFSMKNL